MQHENLHPAIKKDLERAAKGEYPWRFQKGDVVKHEITGYLGEVRENWHEFCGVGVLVKFENKKKASRYFGHYLRLTNRRKEY